MKKGGLRAGRRNILRQKKHGAQGETGSRGCLPKGFVLEKKQIPRSLGMTGSLVFKQR
jgi:hypothetical protein